MASYLTSGANKFRKAREWATPTLKESAFLKRGVLTPEEFVRAGDELVYKCPTWCWESGDPKKKKTFLPDDKQYLVTRNVPCPARVSVLENSVVTSGEDTAQIDEKCGVDDWLISHLISAEEQQHRKDMELEEQFDIIDEHGDTLDKGSHSLNTEENLSANSNKKLNEVVEEMGDDDEYTNMEEFEDDNVLKDEAAAISDVPTLIKSSHDSNIIKVRTYDLSITYDKYYQTPRVWMMGYNSMNTSQPLTGQEMMEDVMSDYANRTVTIDPHPHISSPHASIHPCQHGAVMKTIVRNLIKASSEIEKIEGGNDEAPSVEMYMFIFLKFVSSIIPTINYDFTMDVTASTKK